jgi:hypothetical protein
MRSRLLDFRQCAWIGVVACGFASTSPAGDVRPLRDSLTRVGGYFKQSWYANRSEPEGQGHGEKCGCKICYARPYQTSSCLYGYVDYAYKRGPIIDLGAATLQPGFRGYGPFGSPGYGLGSYPTSRIDVEAARRGFKLAP